jgi:hypothetical protein
MILYNVTIKVDHHVVTEWVRWMKVVHIPDVMKTGIFSEHKFCRLLTVDETEGITYAVQYFCKDVPAYEKYQNEFAAKLQAEHQKRYEGKFVAFRTLMQVIS